MTEDRESISQSPKPKPKTPITMQELLVDFITSLDGYGGAEGWPGWWGLQGPEYLAWMEAEAAHDATILMGANTYRLMRGFAEQADAGALGADETATTGGLDRAEKVVFSSTLEGPLDWANTRLVRTDAVEEVRRMKEEGDRPLTTLGSVALCRSLLAAGLVDRFRVVVFPVITGATGSDRIYDGYPDVALDRVTTRTFDGTIQLLEGVPRILDGPPGTDADA